MPEQLDIDPSHPGASHLAVTVDERVARIELRRPEVVNALHPDTHRAPQAAVLPPAWRSDVGACGLVGGGWRRSAGASCWRRSSVCEYLVYARQHDTFRAEETCKYSPCNSDK